MKIGCVGLAIPAHVEPAARLYRQIQKVADLGGQITGVSAWDLVADERQRLRACADDKGVELESYIAGAFALIGPERGAGRVDTEP